MRARLLAASLLLAAAGTVWGRAGWILVKAQVAQVLLRGAWADTLERGVGARPWPWADTWPVARLEVPEHGVDLVVLAGASGRTMAFGPGHLDSSAAPGEPGNCVLSGHRDTHFAFLARLESGDRLVLVTPEGRRHVFRVAGHLVVDQSALWVAGPSEDAILTLVTCFPFSPALPGGPLRYVIRAEEVEIEQPEGLRQLQNALTWRPTARDPRGATVGGENRG